MDHSFWTRLSHTKFKVALNDNVCLPLMFLSYISEAAASLLDERLDLHIVPPTQLVSFSSPVRTVLSTLQLCSDYFSQAFFYDWLDRTAAKKGKPLPEKIGSLQYFLNGFQGAF